MTNDAVASEGTDSEMPLKINGYSLPVKDIITIGAAVFWLAGLSFQVSSNAEEIEEQSDTNERLVRIEEKQQAATEDIKEIKTEQKDQGKKLNENAITLAKILEKVSE